MKAEGSCTLSPLTLCSRIIKGYDYDADFLLRFIGLFAVLHCMVFAFGLVNYSFKVCLRLVYF